MASAGHATSKGAGDLSDGLSLLFTAELAVKINPARAGALSSGRWSSQVSCSPLHQETPAGLGRLRERSVWAGAVREAADAGELFARGLPTPCTPASEGGNDCKSSLFQVPLEGMSGINIFICVCRKAGSFCVSSWRGRKRNETGISRREQPVPGAAAFGVLCGSRGCRGVPPAALEMASQGGHQ